MNRFLFEKRLRWSLNWRGWLTVTMAILLTLWLTFRLAYPILAPIHRIPANVLVVEGWLPEYALAAAIDEFQDHGYEHLVTSGGPLWEGHHAAGFHSYAELAAQIFRSMQFPTNQLHVAPGPKVWRHRTYHSALAVKHHLKAADWEVTGVNVMTLGPHGKRTQIIYHDVLADQMPVGIISFPSAEYDADRWWKTSEGTKHILTESMAAAYEWLFKSGRPSREANESTREAKADRE